MRPDDPALGRTRITVGRANFEAVPRDTHATLEKMGAVIAEAAGTGCGLVTFPELALRRGGVAPSARTRINHANGIEVRPSGPTARHVARLPAAPHLLVGSPVALESLVVLDHPPETTFGGTPAMFVSPQRRGRRLLSQRLPRGEPLT